MARDGKDGTTPVIGVDKYTDGNYYWTIDTGSGAKWLKDASGNMIRTTGDKGATGAAGKDAISPQLRINSDTNIWEISTDGGKTWTSTGVNATELQVPRAMRCLPRMAWQWAIETVTFTLADGKTTSEILLNQGMRIAANIHDDIVMISGEKLLISQPARQHEKRRLTSILAEVKCVSGTSIDWWRRARPPLPTHGALPLRDLYYTVIPITTSIQWHRLRRWRPTTERLCSSSHFAKKDGTTVIACARPCTKLCLANRRCGNRGISLPDLQCRAVGKSLPRLCRATKICRAYTSKWWTISTWAESATVWTAHQPTTRVGRS